MYDSERQSCARPQGPTVSAHGLVQSASGIAYFEDRSTAVRDTLGLGEAALSGL